MFKLIVIIIVGGSQSNSGVSVSQAEYVFDTYKQCQYVKNTLILPENITYLNQDRPHNRRTTIMANCFSTGDSK